MEDEEWEALVKKLTLVQHELYSERIPALIVLEGCSGRVIGRIAGDLLDKLEPRGVRYAHFDPEKLPSPKALLNFLASTPAKGQLGIFDRGWYSFIAENLENIPGEELDRMIYEANTFERYLIDNGVIIVKIFLRAEADEVEALSEKFGPRHKKKSFLNDDHIDTEIYCGEIMKDVISRTDTPYGRWSEIKIEEPEITAFNSITAITSALSHKLKYPPFSPMEYLTPMCGNPRKYADLTLKAEGYKDKLEGYSKELVRLQSILAVSDRSLVVVFEGRDSAGKGGSIKRLAHALNPRGYVARSVGVPTPEERDHTYLWRFCADMPADGHITIFDRSWYGRMMVEPIEGLCTHEEYVRSAKEINGFERAIVDTGAVLIKFWMEISSEEQLKRFNARIEDPLKNWKITDEDWRNREKWDVYTDYIDDMIESTNTPDAPWYVVESEDKKYGRLKVMETVIEVLDKQLCNR
ncbi:MAG: AMP-polyphosphate phosphotransferase [Candidatus Methanomethylophilaceae archaeon]|nr:AMP-polyphosphate phosphotransferase [Candidatus Methanomethylophilaceae archaeon]